MCNDEIFVPIESTGFEISSFGRVKYPNGFIKDFSTRPKSQYYQVYLGKSYTKSKGEVMVHRLVAEAFIPNPENKPQVNHIDGNKHNNRVENLEWVTGSENMQHAYRTGLSDRQRLSEAHKGKKLSEEHKRNISLALKGRAKSLEWRRHIGEGRRGKTVSAEGRLHMSLARKGMKYSGEGRQHISMGLRKRYESPEERIKTGLVTKGTIWVTDGTISKRIKPDQLDEYLQKGFRRGKTDSRSQKGT